MRYIFMFLSLNIIIYGSILHVKGQCTLSACTDISTGSHDCSIEAPDECYQNDRNMLGVLGVLGVLGGLSFNKETICERFQEYDETVCPDGFDYVSEIKQCLFLNLEPMTWENARTACARMKTGAQMVSIKDSTKQAAVRRYLEHQFTNTKACFRPGWLAAQNVVWINGQRQNPDRCDTPFVWKYKGGSEIPFEFTKWGSAQPDCNQNAEQCVHIAQAYGYTWNDARCTFSMCSVCEI